MTALPEDNWDMLDDGSPAALTIGFVIAGALYGVTYLSLVRLLRYPRNWRPPSLPMSLTTAGLATVTVAYVSVSSGGVEHGAKVFEHATCHHKPEVVGGVSEAKAAALLRDFFKDRH